MFRGVEEISSQYIHSVSLEKEKCKGCTNCIKRCPTEAIRVRAGKAEITSERCVDCGECIRICPHRAKKATCDGFEILDNYKYKIVLPPPALYGQFDNLDDLDYVLNGLLKLGFDDVFEVSRAAEIVSGQTRDLIKSSANIKKPVISSACPAITRLISVSYPNLCDHVLTLLPPVELAAKMARTEALETHKDLKSEDIGIFFISPCPAKASYIKNPEVIEKSDIDGAFSISAVYFRLLGEMKKISSPTPIAKSGIIGIGWASSGGEAAALFNEKYLAADGVENVIKVLEEVENGNFSGLDFIELNACNGGCVGGVLNVENPYIAKARLQRLRKYLPVSQNKLDEKEKYINMNWERELVYKPVLKLDQDRSVAVKMMRDIDNISEKLPSLDCGACGAPSCKALAEDIVRGLASADDCLLLLREKYNHSAAMTDK